MRITRNMLTPALVSQGTSKSLQAHQQSVVTLMEQLSNRLKTMDTLVQSEVRDICLT